VVIGATEVLNTIWIGLIYMMLALPLTLSYRTTRILNFVHVNFITIGAYVGAILSTLGLKDIVVAVVVAFLINAGIALLDHVAVFTPLMRREATDLILMVASLGLWIFYKYLTYAVVDVLSSQTKINMFSLLVHLNVPPDLRLGNIIVSGKFLATIAVVGVIIVLLYMFMTRTALGKAIRAVADNPTLAEISGIPRDRVINVTWILCGGIAGVGGLLWGLFSIVTPEVGDSIILQIFAVSVIGGLSSLPLTALGAFIISGAENVLMSLLNITLSIPVSFRPFISFLTLLIVIIVWPPLGAGGGLPYRFGILKRLKIKR